MTEPEEKVAKVTGGLEAKFAKPTETQVHPNQGLLDAEVMTEEEFRKQEPEIMRALKARVEAWSSTEHLPMPSNTSDDGTE